MSDLPVCAIEAGVPSHHIAAAAVRVARMIDPAGSEIADLRRSYHQHASGAYHLEPDMIKGETLLIDCGLVRLLGTRLVPTSQLLALDTGDDVFARGEITAHVLVTLPPDTDPDQVRTLVESNVMDAARREELLLALSAKFNDAARRAIGEVGEELVVRAAKEQLIGLGHPHLAVQVRQVSLGSDALGYDVTAPRTIGNARLFEVKSSAGGGPGVSFFVSRNEVDTGRKYPDDWFLICCRIHDVAARTGEILGWCGHAVLEPDIPSDRGAGAWQDVHITLAQTLLTPGLPH